MSRAAAGGPTAQRWARVTELFGEVLDLPPRERPARVDQVSADEPDVGVELRSLLEAHERPGEFLPDAAPASPVDLSGRSCGPYRLLRPVGCGGMGSVYLAERSDGSFSKQVAVKLLSPAFVHEHKRFHRERELLARLEHPNVARLLDGGTTPEGWPYLVMEYVEGTAIDRYCADRDLSLEQRLVLLRQVCAGLAHAHQRLVIHRDIKPENILVTGDGTAKLLDFGIATLTDPVAATMHRPGTPAYSSPEQLAGHAITTASDIYSVGVLAYVLLAGRWPYPGSPRGLADTVQTVLSSEPVMASRLAERADHARSLRGDLDNVLAKAVAKEPDRRYANVEQLADDLDAYLHGFPVGARRGGISYRARRFAGRHKAGLLAGAGVAAALIGAATVSAWYARMAERRVQDMRQLVREVVVDVSEALAPVPGTTAARKTLVETASRYLDRLRAEGGQDEGLRQEIAAAYIQVGKVQGGAFLPNLGDTVGAVSSFRKSIAAISDAKAGPALERLRMEAHLQIAQLAADPVEGAPDFERAIAVGEALLARQPGDVAMLALVAQAYHGKATIAHVTDHVPDHLRNVERAIDLRERILALAPGDWQSEVALAREYAQHALALAARGDPASAWSRLGEARALLIATSHRHPANQLVKRGLAEIHSRAVPVLVSSGRVAAAVAEAEHAVALLQPLVASDRENAQYRSDLATAWLWLGGARRAQGRLDEALVLAQQALEVRRREAAGGRATMFVPWGLATNLNVVGELLLEVSPANAEQAHALFGEARDIAARTLHRSPRFNRVRRELAVSYEGLALAAAARHGNDASEVSTGLRQSVDTWNGVFAHSVGDERQAERRDRVARLLAALPEGRLKSAATPTSADAANAVSAVRPANR